MVPTAQQHRITPRSCSLTLIGRQLYRLLERYDQPGVEILKAT
jgi:hypothetical protein